MRISVIASKRGWQTKELKKAAKRIGVSLEIRDILVVDKREAEKLGDIVLWRSSSLDKFAERTAFLNLLKDKIIINHAIVDKPFLANKFFQQKYFERHSKTECIPTFKFKTKKDLLQAINTKKIKFPFVIKPDYGSQGKNIILAKSRRDVNALENCISDYTIQKFIQNKGDFRVLVLGGKILGAIKRTAGQNSFLNNLAQGGSAEKVVDPIVFEKLHQISSKVSSIFDLTICGIDIIYDIKQKKYLFLEINTVPEWKGFQKATGIKVAEEIIKLCIDLYKRKNKSTLACVEDYYYQNFQYLYKKQFHFASRLSLWSHDKKARSELTKLKNTYLKSPAQKIKSILLRKDLSPEKRMLNKELRKRYLNKYSNLIPYNQVLFMHLFANTLFGQDLKKTISNIIPKENLLDLSKKLSRDKKAIAILSTHAVNYFYLLQYYLDKKKKEIKIIDPAFCLQIAKKEYLGRLKRHLNLKTYLLTHCLIGESYFYSQPIIHNRNTCLKIVKFLENLIQENYFQISLDNKLEFLVCAELCQYNSSLKKTIFSEAERSLANVGNFIIDKFNDNSKKNTLQNELVSAEHRNVLFIMANRNFVLNKRRRK